MAIRKAKTAKKTAARKAPAKAKKSAAKPKAKAAARKAPAKKPAAKKVAAKKPTVKNTAAKKPAVKKSPAKKTAPKAAPKRRVTASLQPLAPKLLDAVVSLDSKITGRSRRGFFEKRLNAATAEPRAFIQIGAMVDGKIAGFVFAHLLDGEFGGKAPVAVLDAIGVDPAKRGYGIARSLMAALDQAARNRGVREMVTQADWNENELVRFIDAAGFSLAPRLVLERSTQDRADF